MEEPEDDDQPLYDRPSKSQVKRDMTALQELGERLVALSRERLRQLPIPERLYDAIIEAQRTRSFEGRRRQRQYVGKLMRDVDPEPLRAQLAIWDGSSQAEVAQFHQYETLRERLLESDDQLTAFIARHPEADPQHLRAMIRAARKENAANATLNPGQEPQRKQYRALFQEIKRLQSGSGDDEGVPAPSDEDDD